MTLQYSTVQRCGTVRCGASRHCKWWNRNGATDYDDGEWSGVERRGGEGNGEEVGRCAQRQQQHNGVRRWRRGMVQSKAEAESECSAERSAAGRVRVK